MAEQRRYSRTVRRPTLVILGGLPAVGKSTVASVLNETGMFAYIRIDSIEQALRDSGEMGPDGVQAAGYLAGYAVSGDLLDGGNDVLVECVNPIEATRAAWRDVAETRGAAVIEVELHCSAPEVHRARAEGRVVDVPGLKLPDWQAIQTREYDAWDSADLHIDTGTTSPHDAASLILGAISAG
ncbi:AAA family ATPase [Demequina subtropica]|uniref:AAA family ATPase n=1 Tax=Demequina subtropica TaxID=1638989 RepID=UPI000782CC08|nr:AAA family ATPase [Demequina subtropica]